MTPVPRPRSAAARPAAVLRRRSASARLGDPARDAREQRLRAPLAHERLDRRSPRSARRARRRRRGGRRARPGRRCPGSRRSGRAGASRAGRGERRVQRDPAAHRVARERERAVGERAQVGVAGGERGRPRAGERAVAAEVRRERPVACRQRARRTGCQLRPVWVKPWSRTRSAAHRRAHDDQPIDTYLNLRAFVDELVRCGLREACTSPGSRSTPLVLSLAREPRPARHVAHRRALRRLLRARPGQGDAGCPSRSPARRAPRPPNYAPAVIEAHEARVPLLVLTADRPPELRDVGAGQTIDQVKLYGSAAKWFVEVDDHAGDAGARALAARARLPRVLDRARRPARPGAPELLAARAARARRRRCPTTSPAAAGAPAGGRGSRGPRRSRARRAGARSTGSPPSSSARPRALLVAGRAERDPRLGAALAALRRARRRSRCSPNRPRARAAAPAAIAHYDALLRDPAWAAARAPELVLRVGDLPTSKPLRAVAGRARRRDAADRASTPRARGRTRPARRRRSLAADPRATLAALAGRLPRSAARRGWLEDWTRRRPRRRGRDRRGARPAGLSEPRVAAELGVAAAGARRRWSSPPRCRCATSRRSSPRAPTPPRVLANRGANGIDGTVSDRVRRRRGRRGPVVLLIGDVALAHDLGGLLAARRLGLAARRSCCSTTTAAASSHFLPVAGAGDAFERARRDAARARLRARRRAVRARPRARRRPPERVPRGARRRARGGAHDADPRPHRPRGERRAAPRACGRPSGPPSSVPRPMAQERLIDIPGDEAAAPPAAPDLEGHRRGRHRPASTRRAGASTRS